MRDLFSRFRQRYQEPKYEWRQDNGSWILEIPKQGLVPSHRLSLYLKPDDSIDGKILANEKGTVTQLTIEQEVDGDYRVELEAEFFDGKFKSGRRFDLSGNRNSPKSYKTVHMVVAVIVGDLYLELEKFKKLFTELNLPSSQRKALDELLNYNFGYKK
ncbi:MAG: hypothetical protein AABX33_01795 [Nanoarchaeota archaeon]